MTKKSPIFSKIPSLITLLNLICGFFSIILVAKGEYLSGVLILIASCIFDLLDGFVARKFGWESRMGIELDSLADGVSFVIAPAFIVYNVIVTGIFGILAGVSIACFGMLRLARFNVKSTPGYFEGMSTPYFTVIVMLFYFTFNLNSGIKINNDIIGFVLILISYLMVSKIRFPSFKDKEFLKYKFYAGIFAIIIFIMIVSGVKVLIISLFFQLSTVTFLIFIMFKEIINKKKYLIVFLTIFVIISVFFDVVFPNSFLMIIIPLFYSTFASPLIQLSLEKM